MEGETEEEWRVGRSERNGTEGMGRRGREGRDGTERRDVGGDAAASAHKAPVAMPAATRRWSSRCLRPNRKCSACLRRRQRVLGGGGWDGGDGTDGLGFRRGYGEEGTEGAGRGDGKEGTRGKGRDGGDGTVRTEEAVWRTRKGTRRSTRRGTWKRFWGRDVQGDMEGSTQKEHGGHERHSEKQEEGRTDVVGWTE